MKVVNISNSNVQVNLKKGGSDIFVTLNPGWFVFSPFSEVTKSLNLQVLKNNISVFSDKKPEGAEYYIPYNNQNIEWVIKQKEQDSNKEEKVQVVEIKQEIEKVEEPFVEQQIQVEKPVIQDLIVEHKKLDEIIVEEPNIQKQIIETPIIQELVIEEKQKEEKEIKVSEVDNFDDEYLEPVFDEIIIYEDINFFDDYVQDGLDDYMGDDLKVNRKGWEIDYFAGWERYINGSVFQDLDGDILFRLLGGDLNLIEFEPHVRMEADIIKHADGYEIYDDLIGYELNYRGTSLTGRPRKEDEEFLKKERKKRKKNEKK